MTELRSKRRFQFSRRRLLLWTIVVAAWSAWCIHIAGGVLPIPLIASWLPAVALARLNWNRWAAVITSFGYSVIVITFVNTFRIGLTLESLSIPQGVFIVVFMCGGLIGLGFFVILIVEVAVLFINWVDRVFESNTPKNDNE